MPKHDHDFSSLDVTTLAAVTGAGKKHKTPVDLGPEELPPLDASPADVWKFYTGKEFPK